MVDINWTTHRAHAARLLDLAKAIGRTLSGNGAAVAPASSRRRDLDTLYRTRNAREDAHQRVNRILLGHRDTANAARQADL